MADNELVRHAQAGDDSAIDELMRRFSYLVRARARGYFLMGADREDLLQEGLIGLFKAIRDYDPDKGASFISFADLCITRQIITAVKTTTRQKHIPLNYSVSLQRPIYYDDDRSLIDSVAAPDVMQPDTVVAGTLLFRELIGAFREILSDLEWSVLQLYVKRHSFDEIASALSVTTKSVDNAVWRVKRKISRYLQNNGLIA